MFPFYVNQIFLSILEHYLYGLCTLIELILIFNMLVVKVMIQIAVSHKSINVK
ncbi:hypothetical protein PROFFT_A_00260 [Candidatus Profftia tarda]|uniref:Uncharacterized protein n=1 Tax=Candidatus Profftia tarda TaxID=1177216 RepID=A0A8E4GIA9_9ENTR|nr:hypothetical protein PROFFT_A_00260 [Candidatus Profftia tarda]